MEVFGNLTRRDLKVSIGVIGFIIALAISQLAVVGNWQKALRVSLAFVVYIGLLLSLVRSLPGLALASNRLRFWIFALAAGVSEALSGWLRPDWRLSDAFTLPIAAAVLIGGLHWLTLTAWRPLLKRILSGGT